MSPKYAEWWATPPRHVGPLVIAITLLVLVISAVFIMTGKLQLAILACGAGVFLVLLAVIDLLAELLRYQRLLLEALEKKDPPQA